MLKINLARNKTVIILGILSLCFILLFIKLSAWQFNRAHEKALIIEKFQQANNNDFALLPNQLSDLAIITEYTVIKIQGYFDTTKSILLSNQYHNHQLGYHVLTPFVVSGQHSPSVKAILVDRGWVNLEFTAHDLINQSSETSKKQDLLELTGLLRKSNKNQYIMGNNVSKISPKNTVDYYQIQKINLSDPELINLFTYELSNLYLQLLTPTSAGFNLDWTPVNISPQKHKAYAIQWLLLAISVVLLYSYLCYKTYKAD